jgi:DNA excision repair protein ERCC-2
MELFPFDDVRAGQKGFLSDCRSSLRKGETLIAEAPTGTGKTAAAISAALEWALEYDGNVFFLTSRHSQHKIAIETAKLINDRFDIDLKAVDFIGKRWMCNQDVSQIPSRDFFEYCSALREDGMCSFYNNTFRKSAPSSLAQSFVDNSKIQNVEEFIKSCPEMCPYEVQALIAKKSRFIVGDYYHIFSDNKESFLIKCQKELDTSVLIVDEAHNLPDRVRGLLSKSISSFSMRRCRSESEKFGGEELVSGMGRVLESLRPGEITRSKFVYEVEKTLKRDYLDVQKDLESIGEVVKRKNNFSSIHALSVFLEDWLGPDLGYFRFVKEGTYKERKFKSLNFSCLDPSVLTGPIFKKVWGSVLMSATLSPQEMYADLLGCKSPVLKSYPSPFPPENRLSLIVPTVTTAYKKRSPMMYEKIADEIARSVKHVGNAAVFFPSYMLQKEIGSKVADRLEKPCIWEESGLSKAEKAELFSIFSAQKERGAVLMGVVGGSFSEGVDFLGDLLHCAVIVGLPLERPTIQVKALINYYDKKFGKGWEYGYTYPAMNRVNQALGRVIRAEDERGVVVLLDERYTWERYNRLLSGDFTATRTPEPFIKDFWGGN